MSLGAVEFRRSFPTETSLRQVTPESQDREAWLLELVSGEEHWRKWLEHPASELLHHDGTCCAAARSWLLAYARSMEISTLGNCETRAPAWISQRWDWGPSPWPMAWCELVKREVLDCGVFAVLAREIFRAQGISAHPAQALLHYEEACTQHWKQLWATDPRATFPWVGKRMVYHELCVLELPDGTARFYDSTWGQWYHPEPRAGHGAILALRSECPRLLKWGGKIFQHGDWVKL